MAEPSKRGLLSDEKGLHLLTLDLLCLKEFGPEFIGYEPEALLTEAERAFGPVGRVTQERLMACQILHANESFWTEWEVFEKLTACISGELAVFSYTQPPDPEEIAVALVTAAQINSRKCAGEVNRYIAACCQFDGLFYLESPLDTAAEALSDYFRSQGMEPDYSSVADLLRRTDKPFEDPDSVAEVQANKALSVREAVRSFEREVAKQIKQVVR